jgi:hypothetical protein
VTPPPVAPPPEPTLPVPLPPPSKPGGPTPPRPAAGAVGVPPPPVPAVPRQYSVAPRYGTRFNIKIEQGQNGEKVILLTGGAVLNVRGVPGIGLLDLEADRVVIWSKGGGDPAQLITNMQTTQGETSNDLEFYLAGHVEIRQQEKPASKEIKTLRAEEVYYDVNRNVAVAIQAQLELRSTGINPKSPLAQEPLFLSAAEVLRLNADTFKAYRAVVFSSKLPDDPGLKVLVSDATVEERTRPATTLFNTPVVNRTTGQPVIQHQSIVTAWNVVGVLEGVPFFYTPYLKTDAEDPLGPIQDVRFGYNRIFGTEVGTTLNVYKLLGVLPYEGTNWRLLLDYLSARGPTVGTTFNYVGKLTPGDGTPFNPPATYNGQVLLYGMYDRGFDNLGGGRPNLNTFEPDGWRGRAWWRQGFFDLPYGFTVQTQLSAFSDRNYLEQYFKREFDTEPMQNTYIYVREQIDNWAWTGLYDQRLRNWITETEWLPRFDGYLIGQSFFDRLTYHAWADVAYARLRTTSDPPGWLYGQLPPPPGFPPYISNTDVGKDTGRASFMQELSLPLHAGAFTIVPYGKLDVAGYTNDLEGKSLARVWGGGGVRASIPFTRLYPDVQSDYLNLNGINHKIVASVNGFFARASDPYTKLPQLDRLNDDITDQALRDFRPQFPVVNGNGYFLATSKLFDPQVYAIRRLVDNRIDTLDSIEVVQGEIDQRWQTKRGYPGAQHIIDWMTLDLSFSYFPDSQRDNFGKPFAFLQYNYLWNIGDRTALESTGWWDPMNDIPTAFGVKGEGPVVWTIGMYFNRPDRTNFYLGYREIEPVQSRAVTASVTYVFSPKYAMTLTTSYDFGISQALTNSILFTRIGTDLQVSLGVNYNAFQNSFGLLVEVVPNLVPLNRRYGAIGATGPGAVVGR